MLARGPRCARRSVDDDGAEAVAAVEGVEGGGGRLHAAERVRDVGLHLQAPLQVPAPAPPAAGTCFGQGGPGPETGEREGGREGEREGEREKGRKCGRE